MKRAVLFGFLCVILVQVLQAGTIPVDSAVFSPQSFHVGDRITITINTLLQNDAAIEEPDNLPVSQWFVINRMQIDRSNETVVIIIEMISFYPGVRTLPPIYLGDYRLEHITIQTSSVLSSDTERFGELKSQVLIPFTRLLLGLALGLLILVPLVGVRLFNYVRRFFRVMFARHRFDLPRRSLDKKLEYLTSKINEMDDQQFYISLIMGFRHYLSKRLVPDCKSATTSEMHMILLQHINLQRTNQIISLFKYSDQIKFGHDSASETEKRRHVNLVTDIMAEIEEEAEKNVDF